VTARRVAREFCGLDLAAVPLVKLADLRYAPEGTLDPTGCARRRGFPWTRIRP